LCIARDKFYDVDPLLDLVCNASDHAEWVLRREQSGRLRCGYREAARTNYNGCSTGVSKHTPSSLPAASGVIPPFSTRKSGEIQAPSRPYLRAIVG
jgi:hypothetical protein